MSNDMISMPRELLERLISATINGRGPGSPTERDAKALLAQRCTCPSGDGSLRWPCPVHQAETTAAASFADGIEAAAKLIERRMDEYVNEHGSYDHDTGYTEFPGNGEETVEEWLNLAEGIRAIKPDAKEPVCPPEPVSWIAEALGEDGSVYRHNTSTVEITMRDVKFAWGESVVNRYKVVIAPLYRHPPAQAPVVLPERKPEPSCMTAVDDDREAAIWNACLDEFKRLNPGITEAAPLSKS